MKKISKIQIITLVAIISYIIWEVLVNNWKKNLPDYDPIIRVDLIIILPILFILVIVSLIQFFRNNKKK